MKVLLTGGGTGGHINPALAIADYIRSKQPDCEIEFVGTEKGMENRLVKKAGYKLHYINIQGLRRSLSLENIKTAFLTVTSLDHAARLLKKLKPDLVVGTGGYVCYPLCRAAAAMGIPSAVHESNAVPGLAVRMLAPHIDIVFTNFEAAENNIKPKYRNKIIRVGNPSNKKHGDITYEQAREQLGFAHKYRHSILIYGGSLGAGTINKAAAEYAAKYLKDKPDTVVTHAAGASNYEEVKKTYSELGVDLPNLELLDYIYDMPVRQAAADVIVCRSGAMTTSEIASAGRAAIFVPSPNVTDDQQYKNAKVLADAGAAMLIRDADFNADTLYEASEKILNDREYRASICENVRKFASDDANERIYEELMKLVENRKK
ncbi:MAG: undecaprenyldiphospho-muramoylpentapeptide beta-N-acetylglucosaminyltransferase [Clostridia bacterium]|nr:undecaprenyldiphospho-muramoylpentapeptide beta-N-acetylglucosaminyltransferase [Clostridia bacterium]MBQ3870872.1 undecaprenyldiphospho-muramoylpentapeptide beta-N-acetylglucosaminyltransferase [Clostridia bacterium]